MKDPTRPPGPLPPADPLAASTPRLSRRNLLRAGLAGTGALALGGLLGGCGGGAASGGAQVRFWSPFIGGDGGLAQRMISDVEKAAPHLLIESTALAWGNPYYTKLAMASAGGRSPEVAVMHLSRLAGYAPGGLLRPFDLDLLAEFGVSESEFVPKLWKSGQYDGLQYAVPLDTHPVVLFYNKTLADEAGLLGDDGKLVPFDSADAYIEASHRMSEITGGEGTAYGHVNDASQCWRLFGGLYRQTGEILDLSDSGGRHNLNHDAALEVFEFLHSVFDDEHSSNSLEYPAALAAFTDRRAGLFMSGEWELPGLKDAVGEDLGAVTMPTFFAEPASYADSHSFVLPKQAEEDPKVFRAAHEFVAEILKASLTWAEAGHIPAFQPIVEADGYAELSPQADYRSAGDNPSLDPPAWFTGAASQFHDRLSTTMTIALMGDGPEAAVESMDTRLTELLQLKNPVEGGRT